MHPVLVIAVAVLAAWALGVLLLGLGARALGASVGEAVRVMPDLVRLVAGLARDPAVPRRTRVVLGLGVAWLAMPFDLVPDVIPVLGVLDDVVVALLVVRAAIRAAGLGAVAARWRGTPEGLDLVLRACGMAPPPARHGGPARSTVGR